MSLSSALITLLLGCTTEPPPGKAAPAVDKKACVVPCTSLGAEFGGGKTRCNDDGSPDTSRCVPAGQILEEVATVVKPAERDPTRWANARCNDGTPFSYLLRKTESKTWVLVFEGGFFCDDEKVSCAGRKERLTTTLPVDAGSRSALQDEGVLSRKPDINPTFHQANLAGAQYCSSDLWTGEDAARRPTQGAADGWYFAGRHNARAFLEGVVADGLDDADPETRVLIVGHSAGGAGVVANLDQVQALLPKTTGAGRLKVLLDGSWVPTQPTDSALPNGAKWGALHPECHAAALAAQESPARCVYGPRWWPYAKKTGIPILVQIAGLDATQAPIFGVKGPEALSAWKAGLQESLVDVPWVFSGGRRYHTLAIDAGWTQASPNGTFRDLVTRFWEGGPPERLFPGWDAPASP